MRVSAIRPDSGMMALGDALRVAGMMAGMYNMGAGMGAETAGGMNAGDFANLGNTAQTPANFSNISTGAGQIGGSTAGNFAAQTGSFGSAVPWYQSIGNFFSPADSILPYSNPSGSILPQPVAGATTNMPSHWGSMGWQNNAGGRMINRFGGSQSRAYP
jgi:hypothetical protein